MLRKIELHLDPEFLNVAGGLHFDKEARAALGYLTLWGVANGRYKDISIHGDKDGNIRAVYKNEQGEVTYDLLGQRREDGTYSFHS
jgi:hypothetical protein